MRSAATIAPMQLTRADFTACVDGCVHQLATAAAPAANDPAQTQLRAWLHGAGHALDDGTPIDFALFDAALLSIGERLPAGDAHAQTRLVHAARVLAERIYAAR